MLKIARAGVGCRTGLVRRDGLGRLPIICRVWDNLRCRMWGRCTIRLVRRGRLWGMSPWRLMVVMVNGVCGRCRLVSVVVRLNCRFLVVCRLTCLIRGRRPFCRRRCVLILLRKRWLSRVWCVLRWRRLIVLLLIVLFVIGRRCMLLRWLSNVVVFTLFWLRCRSCRCVRRMVGMAGDVLRGLMRCRWGLLKYRLGRCGGYG